MVFTDKKSKIAHVYLMLRLVYLKLAGFYLSNCMLPCHTKRFPQTCVCYPVSSVEFIYLFLRFIYSVVPENHE